ncbi:MAG: hypothetical protein RL030_378 [Pseudomonadota bacterium]|jgi:hypothetical protein
MAPRPLSAAQRVDRHRAKQATGGKSRIEVTVPDSDAWLVRSLAEQLRSGGTAAQAVRTAVAPLISLPQARTGAELLAFFRNSPLVGVDLHVERDRSPGRKSPL